MQQLSELLKSIGLDRWVVHQLLSHRLLPKESTKEILEQASIYPERSKFFYYLERFLLGTGGLFVLSGIIFFFAYNWFDLPRFIKLAMVQGVSLGLAIFLLLRKPWTFVDKLLLIALSVMVGVQFAVFGQIYQTGANAFSFFWFWFLGISAWVWVGRSPLLWFLYQCLGNAVLITYLTQYALENFEAEVFLIPGVLNIVCLVVWEYIFLMQGWPSKLRWFARLVALTSLYYLWISFVFGIVQDWREASWAGSLVFMIAVPLGLWVYTQKVKDLMIVAMLYLACISGGAIFIFRILSEESWMNAFFSAGILTVAGTMLAAFHTRLLYKKWKVSN